LGVADPLEALAGVPDPKGFPAEPNPVRPAALYVSASPPGALSLSDSLYSVYISDRLLALSDRDGDPRGCPKAGDPTKGFPNEADGDPTTGFPNVNDGDPTTG